MTRPTIGVGVLVWRDRQLLLGKRIAKDQSSCWQFPGGHLENGESVTACASREVAEETGLKVKDLRHFGFTDRTFVLGGSPYITLLVSCEYESGQALTLEPDKCEVWQWFDYQRLPEPLFKPIEIFLLQQDDLYALHKSSSVFTTVPLTRHSGEGQNPSISK
ncbi:MAG: NUDIX hydrolase [Gammaproteobacteria bacterium]